MSIVNDIGLGFLCSLVIVPVSLIAGVVGFNILRNPRYKLENKTHLRSIGIVFLIPITLEVLSFIFAVVRMHFETISGWEPSDIYLNFALLNFCITPLSIFVLIIASIVYLVERKHT